MGIKKTAVSVLCVLLVPVSSTEALMVSDPVICYFLDGILLLYCVIATAFFIREKLCHLPPEAQSPTDEVYEVIDTATRTETRRKRRQEAGGDTYQALQRTAGDENDAYQVIESQGRRAVRKETKPRVYESLQADGRSKDTYETLDQQASAPLPPQ